VKLLSIYINATTLDADPLESVPPRRFGRHIVEALRYFAASGLALAVDFLCYTGLIRLVGINYQVAAVVGFSLGLITIYALSVLFVFQARAVQNRALEFSIFAGIGLLGLALNSLILYLTVEKLLLAPEAGKIISAGFIFCFNFTARKLALFDIRNSR
jgi:putative flippase GtrA